MEWKASASKLTPPSAPAKKKKKEIGNYLLLDIVDWLRIFLAAGEGWQSLTFSI